MKKIFTSKCSGRLLPLFLTAIFALAGLRTSYAQFPASAYGYTASTGTYTDITGTTGLTTLPISFLGDDNYVNSINLGFTFNYCGLNYTQVAVCTNGWVSFNAATTNNQWTNSLANLSVTPNIKPALLPLWDDLGASSTSTPVGAASYVTTGSAPNRVFTFQWKNWQWTVGSGVNISFQVKLYETTNIIEYIYKQETGTGSPSSATIGIVDGAATPTYLTLNNSTATATASSTTFNTGINVKPATNQVYRFTPPPACNTVTSWPAVTNATATPNPICISSGIANLNITSTMPAVTGLTYKWEWSTNGTTGWTGIGAQQTTPAYTATGITTTRYFRCKVICNGDSLSPVWTSGNTPQVVVTDPGVPTAINGSRCGPGSVNLAVTPPGGSTISWYAAPTGGAPLATGNTYPTNFLVSTTTFYASAGSGSTTITAGRPAPQPTSATYAFFVDYGLIFDATQPFTIQSVDVYHTEPTTGSMYVLLKNSSGVTLQTAGPFTLLAGTGTTVGGGATPTTLPININVTAAGTGYRLVDSARVGSIIRDNPISGWSYPLPIGTMGNITGGFLGGSPSTTAHYYFYNWLVGSGCQGARVPVVATVNPAPNPLTKSFDTVNCNNGIGAIHITSPAANYSSYVWTPATELFTDAAATVPYVTGNSAANVYFKSSVVGQHTHSVYATNTAGAQCAAVDTVRMWVQPDSITIIAQPDSVCSTGSGTATLKLIPNTGYAANSIQWQQSTDSISWTNINGATSATYTTGVLTGSLYYRALIKSTTDTCEMPVKHVVLVTPTLVSYADSFNCGPGTVTLTAQSANNSTLKWYNSPTGNIPVGTGSPWTTPFLGVSTDYYVSAGTGTIQPAPTNVVVTGSQFTGTTSVFLYYFYKGAKTQYIITAAQMTAQGYGPGLITALGLQTGSIGNPTMNNVSIELGLTTLSTLPATFQTGLQPVYSAATYTLTANATNTFTFQSPFYWDGTSNIIVGICRINNVTNTSVNNYVYRSTGSAVYRYGDATDMCSAGAGTPTGGTAYGPYTSSTTPHTIFTMQGGCETPRQLVTAHIYPVPIVDLGPDINKCVDAGAVEVLDAGYQPNTPQYLWDNGSTSQVRAISQSGTYNVKVTNQYTCYDEDTILVTLRNNPVVNLGNDTSVCNGVVLALNAGNQGVDYFWNTGQTTQVIQVNSAGSYNVFVTNNLGCVKADTIVVTMSGELPSIQGIQVTNNGQYTFHFTAVNPQNVIGYDWDFGDNTAHSYQASPTHPYANVGNYIVVLKLSSSCGFFSDSSSAHIVGINQLSVSNDELTVFPNPTRATATILNKGDLKMEKIQVFNVLGQVVYEAKADSKDKHTLDLGGFASGVYTIEVFTDKGTVPRKLEVIR